MPNITNKQANKMLFQHHCNFVCISKTGTIGPQCGDVPVSRQECGDASVNRQECSDSPVSKQECGDASVSRQKCGDAPVSSQSVVQHQTAGSDW